MTDNSDAFRKDNGDKDRENLVEAPTRIRFMQARIAELEAQVAALTNTPKQSAGLADELRTIFHKTRLSGDVQVPPDLVARILAVLEGKRT